jgi:hypothetical protein
MKRPSAVKALTVPMAAPPVLVGRIIEDWELAVEEDRRLGHDQVVCVSSPSALRSGKTAIRLPGGGELGLYQPKHPSPLAPSTS